MTDDDAPEVDIDHPDLIRAREFASWLASMFRRRPLWLPIEIRWAARMQGYDWEHYADSPPFLALGLRYEKRPRPWGEGKPATYYVIDNPAAAID